MNRITPSRRAFLSAVGSATWIIACGGDLFGLASSRAATAENAKPDNAFATGWTMQSSDAARDSGDVLSKPDVDTAGWYNVSIPCTVLAGLVANGEYPDLFHGENLKQVPKTRFKSSWWYRKEFATPSGADGSHVWLYFKGINYRANIWLN